MILQVYLVKENEKLSYLEKELNAINEKRTIVFVNTKKACDIVSRRLDDLGYSCTMLHGSKTQVHLRFFFPLCLLYLGVACNLPD